MNFRTTYILFGILGALLLILGVTLWMGPSGKGNTDYVFPSLHDSRKEIAAGDFDTVEIQRTRPEKETLIFVRDPDTKTWKLTEPSDLRADSSTVSHLVEEVHDARKEEKAELTSNLKDWGLDDPAQVVILRKGKDQEWKLNLGNEREGETTGAVYVTSSDEPKKPLAVKKSELADVFKSLNDFRPRDLLTDSALNLTYVAIQKDKHDLMTLEKRDTAIRLTEVDPDKKAEVSKAVGAITGRDPMEATEMVDKLPQTIKDNLFQEDADKWANQLKEAGAKVSLDRNSENRWRIKSPDFGEAEYEGDSLPADAEPKPITGVRQLLEDIEKIRVEATADFVAVGVKDWDHYALEPGAEHLRIEILRRAGNLMGGDLQKPPVRAVLLVGKKADDKGEKVFVRLEGEDAVERVDAKSLTAIEKAADKPDTLRNRDLVLVDQARVDAINIKKPDAFVKLRRGQPSAWKLFLGDSKEDHKADAGTVQELLSALGQKKQVVSFDPGKEADLGFDRPDAVTVSLWVDALQKEDKPGEKKETQPAEADLKLKDEQHPTIQLTFGNRDDKTAVVRRLVGNDKTLMTVPFSLFAKVNQAPLAYLDRSLPSFPDPAQVTGFLLQRNGETNDLENEQKDGKPTGVWKFKQPMDLAGRPAYGRNIEAILADLKGLIPDQLVGGGFEKVSDADLEKYGLKQPSVRAVVTVKTADNKTETHEYLFGKQTEDKGHYYAKQGERELVFLVRPATLDTLREELQDPTVFHYNPEDMTALKMTGWKKVQGFNLTLELERKTPPGWTVKQPDGLDLDDSKVNAFVGELANLKAERFVVRRTGPTPAHKLDEKERTLQIDITVKGEKAPLTLTIGDLDANAKGYFAQSSTRPGDVFLLPQDQFEKVVNGGVKNFTKNPAGGK